jgi:hypothetical protein
MVMEMNIKREAFKAGLIIIFLLIIYSLSPLITSNRVGFEAYTAWTAAWTLLLSICFSFEHFKTWRLPGKIKLNYISLIISAIALTAFIPSTPLFAFWLINRIDILLLVFWYALIHAFYKEA